MKQGERVVFSHTMESMLARFESKFTEARWSYLAALGVSRAKKQTAYEFDRWCQVVEYLAREFYPGVTLGEAEYQLGRDFIERYAETLVGRALFPLLKLLGTKRTVHRLARSFRTGTNFTEVEIQDETANSCLVVFNVVEPRAQLTRGILAKGLELAGLRDLTVSLEEQVGDQARFRLTWST